jgi:hypothetical protein
VLALRTRRRDGKHCARATKTIITAHAPPRAFRRFQKRPQWLKYSQHSECFWKRCNDVWPFRDEPNSGHAVPIAPTDTVRELRWQVIWSPPYYRPAVSYIDCTPRMMSGSQFFLQPRATFPTTYKFRTTTLYVTSQCHKPLVVFIQQMNAAARTTWLYAADHRLGTTDL